MNGPHIKPTVILPDTSPLIHLATVDALPVLSRLGRVVVVDVLLKATSEGSKPMRGRLRRGSRWVSNPAAISR
jgi:hypothetical protein